MSFYNAFKTFVQVKRVEAHDVFLKGQGDIGEFMLNFYALSRKNHLLEKKHNKPSSLELLLSCLSD